MAVKNEVLDFILRSHNCITVILQHHIRIYKLRYKLSLHLFMQKINFCTLFYIYQNLCLTNEYVCNIISK